jgi:outer membrane immunogenic protein
MWGLVMKKYAALAGAMVSVLALGAPAYAADLIIDEPYIDSPSSSSFDWEGAYVGVFGGYYWNFGDAVIGGELGYNFLATENFLLGIEASGLFYLDGTNDFELYVHGKAGFVVDNVAIYAIGGVGTFEFATPLYDIGAGIEVAVTENVTINGQVFARDVWGDFTPDGLITQAGIRFHF